MTLSERVNKLPWTAIQEGLWNQGYAELDTLLTQSECEDLRSLYAQPGLFRSRIDMARFRFGRGEYQYFSYPLPELVVDLRVTLYRQLAGCARDWMAALGMPGNFPDDLSAFLRICKNRGQSRPTPLVLRYRAGDFNCLHQDVYGELVFPFQVVFCLSKPDEEFSGGELLLVEQRPRAQSIGRVIRLAQGCAVVITTRYRPIKGARGFYRANLRHGLSPLRSGERYALGIIFHDAA